ncbi:hypothetical protein FB451DRAFT_1223605 [Mycena latifolia]|nr:hypothetical protein FB451DRAFT_1223605 [Mycena latifolia]
MASEDSEELSIPSARPSEETLLAFWRKISYLSTRTRTSAGRWEACQEIKVWNARNMESCDKCTRSRRVKHCVIEEDQPSCLPCRDGKTACPRRMQFLFESTSDDFFPTMNLFMQVFKDKDQAQYRTFGKTANKRRKKSLPYGLVPKPKIVYDRPPAILSWSSSALEQEEADLRKKIVSLEQELERLHNNQVDAINEQCKRSPR